MQPKYISPRNTFILISLITLTGGLWFIILQIQQQEDMDYIIDEKDTPSLVLVTLLSVFSAGIFYLYYEFVKTRELHKFVKGKANIILEIFFTLMSSTIILIPITNIYQQSLLNQYSEEITFIDEQNGNIKKEKL